MYTRNEIEAQIQFIATVKSLTQSYQEISVMKMQLVRESVLQTRQFLAKLSDVFVDVRANYKSELEKLAKKQKKDVNTLIINTGNKNGRSVVMLLSANTKLYGSIIKEVFDLFLQDIQKNDVDIVVVGRVGKELFENHSKGKRYTYFDLPDNMVSMGDLKGIVEFILKYEKVNVYHGKFVNIFTQLPTVSNVTGDEVNGLKEPGEPEKQEENVSYFFEPSLEMVMNLFGNQVLGSLFKQSVHEGELSKLASRIKAMEDARTNIEKERQSWSVKQNRYKKLMMNKKQIESLSGMSIWGR